MCTNDEHVSMGISLSESVKRTKTILTEGTHIIFGPFKFRQNYLALSFASYEKLGSIFYEMLFVPADQLVLK